MILINCQTIGLDFEKEESVQLNHFQPLPSNFLLNNRLDQDQGPNIENIFAGIIPIDNILSILHENLRRI